MSSSESFGEHLPDPNNPLHDSIEEAGALMEDDEAFQEAVEAMLARGRVELYNERLQKPRKTMRRLGLVVLGVSGLLATAHAVNSGQEEFNERFDTSTAYSETIVESISEDGFRTVDASGKEPVFSHMYDYPYVEFQGVRFNVENPTTANTALRINEAEDCLLPGVKVILTTNGAAPQSATEYQLPLKDQETVVFRNAQELQARYGDNPCEALGLT